MHIISISFFLYVLLNMTFSRLRRKGVPFDICFVAGPVIFQGRNVDCRAIIYATLLDSMSVVNAGQGVVGGRTLGISAWHEARV